MPFRTAAVFLLFAFGFAANAQCQEEGEEHATFVVNRAALTCTPRTLKGTQPLVLTLGPRHGRHLAISRVSDDTWYDLVNSLPPPPMKSLMSPEAFAAARQLILPADTIGYKWDKETGKGTGERIFAKPGQYIVYTSQHMESEEGGYKCTVNYVR
ncbi:MAG TPA: hypothetical protein VJP60_05945 [Rhizomicrobium sp.]|nr:hypothetical protein [Rhizomicrobium sp.]